MKKKILMGICLIVLLIGCIIGYIMISKDKNDSLISISGTQLLEKLNKKETFILLVSQEGCSHCEEYKPILKKVLKKNNINAFELDLTKLKKEDTTIKNEVNTLFNVSGTPTTIFINDGVEKTTLNRLYGNTTIRNLEHVLKERGFIK